MMFRDYKLPDSAFISSVKFDGVPILPPVLTELRREEMRSYQRQAVLAEAKRRSSARHQLLRKLQTTVDEIEDNLRLTKADDAVQSNCGANGIVPTQIAELDSRTKLCFEPPTSVDNASYRSKCLQQQRDCHVVAAAVLCDRSSNVAFHNAYDLDLDRHHWLQSTNSAGWRPKGSPDSGIHVKSMTMSESCVAGSSCGRSSYLLTGSSDTLSAATQCCRSEQLVIDDEFSDGLSVAETAVTGRETLGSSGFISRDCACAETDVSSSLAMTQSSLMMASCSSEDEMNRTVVDVSVLGDNTTGVRRASETAYDAAVVDGLPQQHSRQQCDGEEHNSPSQVDDNSLPASGDEGEGDVSVTSSLSQSQMAVDDADIGPVRLVQHRTLLLDQTDLVSSGDNESASEPTTHRDGDGTDGEGELDDDSDESGSVNRDEVHTVIAARVRPVVIDRQVMRAFESVDDGHGSSAARPLQDDDGDCAVAAGSPCKEADFSFDRDNSEQIYLSPISDSDSLLQDRAGLVGYFRSDDVIFRNAECSEGSSPCRSNSDGNFDEQTAQDPKIFECPSSPDAFSQMHVRSAVDFESGRTELCSRSATVRNDVIGIARDGSDVVGGDDDEEDDNDEDVVGSVVAGSGEEAYSLTSSMEDLRLKPTKRSHLGDNDDDVNFLNQLNVNDCAALPEVIDPPPEYRDVETTSCSSVTPPNHVRGGHDGNGVAVAAAAGGGGSLLGSRMLEERSKVDHVRRYLQSLQNEADDIRRDVIGQTNSMSFGTSAPVALAADNDEEKAGKISRSKSSKSPAVAPGACALTEDQLLELQLEEYERIKRRLAEEHRRSLDLLLAEQERQMAELKLQLTSGISRIISCDNSVSSVGRSRVNDARRTVGGSTPPPPHRLMTSRSVVSGVSAAGNKSRGVEISSEIGGGDSDRSLADVDHRQSVERGLVTPTLPGERSDQSFDVTSSAVDQLQSFSFKSKSSAGVYYNERPTTSPTPSYSTGVTDDSEVDFAYRSPAVLRSRRHCEVPLNVSQHQTADDSCQHQTSLASQQRSNSSHMSTPNTSHKSTSGHVTFASPAVIHDSHHVHKPTRRYVDPFSENIPADVQRKCEKLSALAKGYLTRRLLQTEKIQSIIRTIWDTAAFALQFNMESPIKKGHYSMHDRFLQERVLAQLNSALFDLHEILFDLSVGERMHIIDQDRAIQRSRRYKSKSPVASEEKNHRISAATLKALERKRKVLQRDRTVGKPSDSRTEDAKTTTGDATNNKNVRSGVRQNRLVSGRPNRCQPSPRKLPKDGMHRFVARDKVKAAGTGGGVSAAGGGRVGSAKYSPIKAKNISRQVKLAKRQSGSQMATQANDEQPTAVSVVTSRKVAPRAVGRLIDSNLPVPVQVPPNSARTKDASVGTALPQQQQQQQQQKFNGHWHSSPPSQTLQDKKKSSPPSRSTAVAAAAVVVKERHIAPGRKENVLVQTVIDHHEVDCTVSKRIVNSRKSLTSSSKSG